MFDITTRDNTTLSRTGCIPSHEIDGRVYNKRHPQQTHTLTQAAIGHYNVYVAAALMSALLAPVLDADWLVGLHYISDLQVRVHLQHNKLLSETYIWYRG